MGGLLGVVKTWGEMVKFSHSVFALPFALVAAVMAARGRPADTLLWVDFGLVMVCMVTARSFAMTFNRIVDADVDALNPRTASRPLVSGRISRAHARLLLIASAAAFLAGCAGFWLTDGNAWPIGLGLPVLGYLAFYSYCKRFTSLSHFVLGLAIASAPAAAWIAINPRTLGAEAVLLWLTAAAWIAGFDLIYACQDVAFDRAQGLQSVPARVGVAGALWMSRGCHALTLAGLAAVGVTGGFGAVYWVGVTCVAALLAVEQAMVRANDLSRVNLAFFTVNGVVSLVYAAAAIADRMM